jgi:hypothetical protein
MIVRKKEFGFDPQWIGKFSKGEGLPQLKSSFCHSTNKKEYPILFKAAF